MTFSVTAVVCSFCDGVRLLHDLLCCIQDSAKTASEKNVNILLLASGTCRAICGTMCILCKSGKFDD